MWKVGRECFLWQLHEAWCVRRMPLAELLFLIISFAFCSQS